MRENNKKKLDVEMSIEINQGEIEIIKIVYGAVAGILGVFIIYLIIILNIFNVGSGDYSFFIKILLYFIIVLYIIYFYKLNMKLPKQGFSFYKLGKSIFGKVYNNFNFYKRFYGTKVIFDDENNQELKFRNKDNDNIIDMLNNEKTIIVMKKHMYYIEKEINDDGDVELIYVNFTSKGGKLKMDILGNIKEMELGQINKNSYVTSEGIKIKGGIDLEKILSKENIKGKGNVNKDDIIKAFFNIVKSKGGIGVNSKEGKLFYNIKKLEKMNFFKIESYEEFISSNLIDKSEKIENIIKNLNNKD